MNKLAKLGLVLSMFLMSIQQVVAQCTVNGESVPCTDFFARFGFLFVIIALVGIVAMIFWLWMLIHAIKSNDKNKVVWIVVIFLFGVIGAAVYFFVAKNKG
jgi:multidrug resistance efflux pump